MAMGWDDALMAMLAGSNIFGNLFGGGGEGQDLQTFEGERRGNLSLDPRDVMAHGITAMGRFGDSLNDILSQPVNLRSAYVQDLPSFSGGGLPMPIGVSGRDLAMSDPSLLSLQSPYVNRDPFQGLGTFLSGDPLGQSSGVPQGSNPGARRRIPNNPDPKGLDIPEYQMQQVGDVDEALEALDILNPERYQL